MSDFNALFDEIVTRLGGRETLCEMLGVSSSALSNYRKRQAFPAAIQSQIHTALSELGWVIDDSRLQLIPLNTAQKNIVMIITGGIAAYKALEVARRLMDKSYRVRCVLTKGAEEFISPLSAAALTGQKTYSSLFSLTDEAEMGHIRLAREADLLLVVPATAHFIAKMAHGLADDLASTICLATQAPIVVAPAMNPVMWAHEATQDNLTTLQKRGVSVITPASGDTACGEIGEGRLAEPMDIVRYTDARLSPPHLRHSADNRPDALRHKRIVITSGPTYEPIDPVRFIGNRSSGKQGHALAAAAAARGADVVLVTGPVALSDPAGVHCVHVETAEQMYQACMSHLPADIVICAAAVADWHVVNQNSHKTKKTTSDTPQLILGENKDILKTISHAADRPELVIGFAAETEELEKHATEKLARKGCDWLIANHVDTGSAENVFGSDNNQVSLITAGGCERWPAATKQQIAEQVMDRIAQSVLSSSPAHMP